MLDIEARGSSLPDEESKPLLQERGSILSRHGKRSEGSLERTQGCLCVSSVPQHYRAQVRADPRLRVIMLILLCIYPPLLALVDTGVKRALRQEATASELDGVAKWPQVNEHYCKQGSYAALQDPEDNCFLDDDRCKLRCDKRAGCVAVFRTWVGLLDWKNQCHGNWICTMLPACDLVKTSNPDDRVFMKKGEGLEPNTPHTTLDWAVLARNLATSEPWMEYIVPMVHVVCNLIVVFSQGCASPCCFVDLLLVCLPSFVVLSTHQRVQSAFQSQCWMQLLSILFLGLLALDVRRKKRDVNHRLDSLPQRQLELEKKLLDFVGEQGINLDARVAREGLMAVAGGGILTLVVVILVYWCYGQLVDGGRHDSSIASWGRQIHDFFNQALVGCDPMRFVALGGACLVFYMLSGILQFGITQLFRGARICSTLAPADELRMHAYKTAAQASAAEKIALMYIEHIRKDPAAIQAWVGNNDPTVRMLKDMVVRHGSEKDLQAFVEAHTDQRAQKVLEAKIEGQFNPNQENQYALVDQDAALVDAAFQETLARSRGVVSSSVGAGRALLGTAAKLTGRAAGLGPMLG